jgi:serine/threonine-protein kinase
MAFVIVLVLCIAQIFIEAPRLPDRVASHFTMDGRADGWSGRNAFLVTFAALYGFTALIVGGLGLVLPKIPPAFINMPNKVYWLAPERRAETCTRVFGMMLWMGAATLCFMCLLFRLIVRANLASEGGAGPGSGFWIVMGLYLTYTTGWVVRFFWIFRMPKKD